MSPPSGMSPEERFKECSRFASTLPQDLLTNAQKLRLYAFYKHAQLGPAPSPAPSRANMVAFAKVRLTLPRVRQRVQN